MNKYNNNGEALIFLSRELLSQFKISEINLEKIEILLNS
jgi:hypothetical protein